MINKIKKWLYANKPILTTRKRQDIKIIRAMEAISEHEKRMYKLRVKPVIHDLEKLRADTWNQDKITNMIEWLEEIQ